MVMLRFSPEAAGEKLVGLTDAAGGVTAELLPASYTFSMDYAHGRLQQVQDISATSTVASEKFPGVGAPKGRDARRISRLLNVRIPMLLTAP